MTDTEAQQEAGSGRAISAEGGRGLSVEFDCRRLSSSAGGGGGGMSSEEAYEFDRLGYLVLRSLLTPTEVAVLRAATERLERRANSSLPSTGIPLPPHKRSPWGALYHYDAELGVHCGYAAAKDDNGASTIIEDFFNADDAFDLLVAHPKTMGYIRGVIQERPTINNSEIRLRYAGNRTPSHQPGGQSSGPPTGKYQYQVSGGKIDCKMVRMIYFIHDVDMDSGPFWCASPHAVRTRWPCDDAPRCTRLLTLLRLACACWLSCLYSSAWHQAPTNRACLLRLASQTTAIQTATPRCSASPPEQGMLSCSPNLSGTVAFLSPLVGGHARPCTWAMVPTGSCRRISPPWTRFRSSRHAPTSDTPRRSELSSTLGHAKSAKGLPSADRQCWRGPSCECTPGSSRRRRLNE
jgi:hypothetical protein